MKVTKGAMVVMKGQKSSKNIYKQLGRTIVCGIAFVKFNSDCTSLWHIRLGHMSERGMLELHKRNLLKVSRRASMISVSSVFWGSRIGYNSRQPHTRQKGFWTIFILIFAD